jgi:hypothetical protein
MAVVVNAGNGDSDTYNDISCSKADRKYTELQFCLLFCMGVKLGRSH